MKIFSLSVVVGNRACNASCPYCISKQTFDPDVPHKGKDWPSAWALDGANFETAVRLALRAGATSMLITGKGEPTLYPDSISEVLGRHARLSPANLPMVELQTNGIRFMQDYSGSVKRLERWKEDGLRLVALSTVSVEDEDNRIVFGKKYDSLRRAVDTVHHAGLSCRLCFMMVDHMIDNPDAIEHAIWFAQDQGVAQTTFRPIRIVDEGMLRDDDHDSAMKLVPDPAKVARTFAWVEENGTPLVTLAHGDTVYDVRGQNVALASCLTRSPQTDEIRQLIYYTDGQLLFDWQYAGARLL